jgi:hypothetical protein
MEETGENDAAHDSELLFERLGCLHLKLQSSCETRGEFKAYVAVRLLSEKPGDARVSRRRKITQ